jgi:acylphosphatase
MVHASKIECRRFFVRGKVQGVFFRARTRDAARRLDITGHAINLADGRVEVLACGSRESLQSLRDWLKQGPPMARVDALDEETVDITVPASFRTG